MIVPWVLGSDTGMVDLGRGLRVLDGTFMVD